MLTVNDTARLLTVHADCLSNQFRQDTGVTFTGFANKERIKQAAVLLRHTNMQIQRIASVVGYNNASCFAKQFHRYDGLTSKEYREKCKGADFPRPV